MLYFFLGYLQILFIYLLWANLQVFPFGSVPLKTYLPDGDIDLTVLSHDNEEEDMAQLVCNVLEMNDEPEYPVKDIQLIRAQV